MSGKKIVSLGQCAADTWTIGRMLESTLQAHVIAADSFDEALTALRHGDIDLVLVNRILDHTGESGVDFIDQLKSDETLRDIPVMLVSNYDDAQKQAVSRGALPGFGKSSLQSPQTAAKLREVLGLAENK